MATFDDLEALLSESEHDWYEGDLFMVADELASALVESDLPALMASWESHGDQWRIRLAEARLRTHSLAATAARTAHAQYLARSIPRPDAAGRSASGSHSVRAIRIGDPVPCRTVACPTRPPSAASADRTALRPLSPPTQRPWVRFMEACAWLGQRPRTAPPRS